MDILIDFDGTCVTHDFPNIGKDIGAKKVLKQLTDRGHRLILFTIRCNHDFHPSTDQPDIIAQPGNYLDDAINWFKENNIPLWGIQKNPTQHTWTSSPKPYGHVIIDDTALGCPLIFNPGLSNRPFVDWEQVRQWFITQGILPNK